jgi:[lysine-biosynthesis-protein LysW]---L-2-aminoadipate ligase
VNVAFLAERLRVEERQLADSFKSRGLCSELIKPASLSINLNESTQQVADLILDRGVTTKDTAALSALLATNGAMVVNRPATSRLMADRLALMRHLVIAGLPVPQSRVCFGEESALKAIEEIGYPAVIKTLDVDPAFPSAFVDDRDSAEAIVEHRIVLGHDHTALIQSFQPSVHDRSLRAVVIGSQPVSYDARPHDGWRPNTGESYVPVEGVNEDVEELVSAVISRAGTGVYAVLMIETETGPVVTGIENLVTFRHLVDLDVDAAEMIAQFAISQHAVAHTR